MFYNKVMEKFDLLEGFVTFEELEKETETSTAVFSVREEQTEETFNDIIESDEPFMQKEEDDSSEVAAIVILTHNPNFNIDTNSYDIEILGRPMQDWVKNACPVTPATITAEEEHNIAQIIKPVLTDAEYTVVLYSDTPLITTATINEALDLTKSKGLNVCKLTRGYVFKTEYIKRVDEVYSPETYYFDEEDFITALNFKQLSIITEILRNRILSFHMKNGVNIVDMSATYIDSDVTIGKNVRIEPNNQIKGCTELGEGVILNSGNVINNSKICDGATVTSSYITESVIGGNSKIGPFANIRPESIIGENCRIGDYVEIKKSHIGKNTKVAHLSYVGDAAVGENCNIGCGVVFANYNGKTKNKTTVMSGAFIGSNSNLIAPLVIGENAYIAAGSTITENVPANALAIARERQIIKENRNALKDD